MSGMDSFMWRSTIGWSEQIAVAAYALAEWNRVTRFVTHTDMRERIWTVRHESVAQPFLMMNQDSLRGSLPRMGNPMALLLIMAMVHARPGCMEVSFSNGQKIDLTRFDPADLIGLLPMATHPAHKRLAEISVRLAPMPVPVAAAAR